MRQADLNRAVARATGESVSTITRLGFLLDAPLDHGGNPETKVCEAELCDTVVIDWDELETQRYAQTKGRLRREPALS